MLAALAVVGVLAITSACAGGEVSGTPVAGSSEPSTSDTTPTTTTTPPPPFSVTANDGGIELAAVAASWQDRTDQLDSEQYRNCVLWVAAADSTADVAVYRSEVRDFRGFDGYHAHMLDWISQVADDGDPGKPIELTIGGLPAIQYRYEGVLPNDQRRYAVWYTMVQGEHAYYEVIGNALPSNAAEDEAVIVQAIESFREIGAGGR